MDHDSSSAFMEDQEVSFRDNFQKGLDVGLSGQIVAKSQILLTEPPCLFISLSRRNDSVFVKIDSLLHGDWNESLKINHFYTFFELACCSTTLHGSNETVYFWNTTSNSTYIQIDSVNTYVNPWIETNFKPINYQGVVTSSISPLGMITLDKKLQLCVFFLTSHVHFPMLSIGQQLTVFNAHLTSNNTLVMCTRSNVSVVETNSNESQISLPLARIVCSTFGYGDYCWLQNQFTALENKFSDEFISTQIRILSKEYCNKLRTDLCLYLLDFNHPYPAGDETTLYKEFLKKDFLSSNHDCILYQRLNEQRRSATVVETLEKQFENYSHSLVKEPCDSSMMPYWKCAVHIHKQPIIGYLHLSEEDGYWHLSDSSLSLPCISEQFQVNLQGHLVSISKCKLIVEKCITFDTNSSENIKMYLSIFHGDVTSLMSTEHSTADLHQTITPAVSGCCTICSTARSLLEVELLHTECSLENQQDQLITPGIKNVPNSWTHVHTVVIHFVAAPVKFFESTAHCFILASVLQTQHDSDAGAFPCILVLKGKLLQMLPLFTLGTGYYLHLPPKKEVKTFLHAKLNVQLPWCVVLLPENAVFSRHICPSSVSWWGLCDRACKGLVNVEGVVESRNSQESKFGSQCSVSSPSYGEPNQRTIKLVIRDFESSYTIYLTHWNRRRYPLGLIPGAYVCITMLKQTTSSSSCREYFQATDLTNVSILNLPDLVDTKKKGEPWSLPCDITLHDAMKLESEICSAVDRWTILSVKIMTVCGECSLICMDGPCENPSCFTQTDCVTYVASAKIRLRGMGGRKIVHLKDENVRNMLNLTLEDWEVLCSFSQTHQMQYQQCYDLQSRKFSSTAENIFQLYCMNPMLTNRRVYIRCKSFKNTSNDQRKCLGPASSWRPQSLFCLELSNENPYSQ